MPDAAIPVVVESPTPLPVTIESPTPMPVAIVAGAGLLSDKRLLPRQDQAVDPSRAATTTFQQDLTTAGQRNINLIWETTQGQISKYVILGAMSINGVVLLASLVTSRDLTAAQALALGFVNSLATGVVSFYFSRTNHTQQGGIGPKPQEEYKGR